MRVTKFGHSCLLIEEKGIQLLTDLGSWNETPDLTGLAGVLITHEHADHFDLPKLQALLEKNPDAKVVTHAAVGAKLEEAGIPYVAIAPGERVEVSGVSIESYGTDHAIIYGDTSPCVNTGYLIAEKLFMPGDALHDIPPKAVEVLALPTGGPWMKISEAIDYAKAVKPKAVFPIHDAMYNDSCRSTGVPRWVGGTLEQLGIAFTNLMPGESLDF
jgi:L-ascorbate metabolism protein UlaG (beta-lactamase superfamily)